MTLGKRRKDGQIGPWRRHWLAIETEMIKLLVTIVLVLAVYALVAFLAPAYFQHRTSRRHSRQKRHRR
jgi:hypothetical protein